MVIWFVVLAPILVAEVFRSPMIDFRLVMVGAALPLVEVVFATSSVLHTLLGPVVVLVMVMLGTQGRRLLRRRLLGVPIGLFVHFVLDGSWTDAERFWWPAFGFELGGDPIELERSVAVVLALEAMGVVAAWWAWRRYGLADPSNRRRFVTTGQLNRNVLS